MSKPDTVLTAQEFAQKAGVSAGTVSRWLREGAIKGKKIGGKWSVPTAELAKVTKSDQSSPNTPSSAPPKTVAQSGGTATAGSYSIQEFCDMSYLTEFGIRKWLKEGRLKKITGADGQVRVDASNLDDPHIKRLLR